MAAHEVHPWATLSIRHRIGLLTHYRSWIPGNHPPNRSMGSHLVNSISSRVQALRKCTCASHILVSL